MTPEETKDLLFDLVELGVVKIVGHLNGQPLFDLVDPSPEGMARAQAIIDESTQRRIAQWYASKQQETLH